MIEVSEDIACILYVGFMIVSLFALWVHHLKKSKKRDVIKFTTKKASCEFCAHSYLIDSLTPFHRCPSCKNLNKTPDT
jgi:predicted Zn-ribbon and HTH transcriptional regulator